MKTSPSPSPKNSPIKRLNRPEQLLRSCLLRTEALPAGIFANTSGRTSPEGDEKTPTNFTDQFLLSSKQTPPPPIVFIDSTKSSTDKPSSSPSHQRKRSDGYSSQMTDDEDEKPCPLHVLTDEQLEHLACVYHPLPPSSPAAPSSQTGMTRMSEALLQSLSNPLSKLVLRQ